MLNKIIVLRVKITQLNLRNHLRNFMNSLTSSQYISIQTKLMFKNNRHPGYILGKRYYLDLTNGKDKTLYLNYLESLYVTQNEKRSLFKRVTGIYIEYSNSNVKEYRDFNYRLNKGKPFILKPLI